MNLGGACLKWGSCVTLCTASSLVEERSDDEISQNEEPTWVFSLPSWSHKTDWKLEDVPNGNKCYVPWLDLSMVYLIYEFELLKNQKPGNKTSTCQLTTLCWELIIISSSVKWG